MRIYLETHQIPEQQYASMEPVIRFDESSSSAEDLQEVPVELQLQQQLIDMQQTSTTLPSIDDLNLLSRPRSPEHYNLDNSSSASSESTNMNKRWSSAGELKLPDQGSPIPQRKYPKTPQPPRKQILRYQKGTTLVQYPSGTSAIQHPMLYDLIRLQSQSTGSAALEEESKDDSKSLQCRFCSKDFTTVFARRRHETNVHSTAVPCEFCGQELKTMGRPDALQRHLLRCPALKNKQMDDPSKKEFM